MNRAKASRLLAVCGQMNAGQNDGPRIRVAGAQVVKKILTQVRHGIDIEDEKVRPSVHDEELGLLEIPSQIDLGGRRGFSQCRDDFRG
jgi:hypothetical protein